MYLSRKKHRHYYMILIVVYRKLYLEVSGIRIDLFVGLIHIIRLNHLQKKENNYELPTNRTGYDFDFQKKN